MPAPAPGSDTEQTASTMSSRKSIGIMILDDFSMPRSTPFTMMKWVISMKTNIHRAGRHGWATKPLNEAMKSLADCLAKVFVPACTMYSSVQPATTE